MHACPLWPLREGASRWKIVSLPFLITFILTLDNSLLTQLHTYICFTPNLTSDLIPNSEVIWEQCRSQIGHTFFLIFCLNSFRQMSTPQFLHMQYFMLCRDFCRSLGRFATLGPKLALFFFSIPHYLFRREYPWIISEVSCISVTFWLRLRKASVVKYYNLSLCAYFFDFCKLDVYKCRYAASYFIYNY